MGNSCLDSESAEAPVAPISTEDCIEVAALVEVDSQIFIDKETGDSYEGEFFNGLRNGEGIMDYFSGNRYSGGWKDGL